jgi:hypothetical protein
MNDIVYIDHMKIAGVAILDMQMSKVPIISGYVSNTPLITLNHPSSLKL